jgi:hypothetical protein
LTDYDFLSFLGSPVSLALCGAILLAAFITLWMLLKQ